MFSPVIISRLVSLLLPRTYISSLNALIRHETRGASICVAQKVTSWIRYRCIEEEILNIRTFGQ